MIKSFYKDRFDLVNFIEYLTKLRYCSKIWSFWVICKYYCHDFYEQCSFENSPLIPINIYLLEIKEFGQKNKYFKMSSSEKEIEEKKITNILQILYQQFAKKLI